MKEKEITYNIRVVFEGIVTVPADVIERDIIDNLEISAHSDDMWVAASVVDWKLKKEK